MNYKSVESYLEREERARERKNKNRAVANLLLKKYPQLNCVSKETLTSIVKETNSADRAWRDVLKHREDLRGSDYDEKERLEQQKQVELGYVPGFHRDVKVTQQMLGI